MRRDELTPDVLVDALLKRHISEHGHDEEYWAAYFRLHLSGWDEIDDASELPPR